MSWPIETVRISVGSCCLLWYFSLGLQTVADKTSSVHSGSFCGDGHGHCDSVTTSGVLKLRLSHLSPGGTEESHEKFQSVKLNG
jgi:hypothetical protein